MRFARIDLVNEILRLRLVLFGFLTCVVTTTPTLAESVEDQLTAISDLQLDQDLVTASRNAMQWLEHEQHRPFESTLYASTANLRWGLNSNICAIPLQQLDVDGTSNSSRRAMQARRNPERNTPTGSTERDGTLEKHAQYSTVPASEPLNDGYEYNRTYQDLLAQQHPNYGSVLATTFNRDLVSHIPFFSSSNRPEITSLIELTNRSVQATSVTLYPIDDVGRTFGPITLLLESQESKRLTTQDLEDGNPDLGLIGIGRGIGDWRIRVQSQSPIEINHTIASKTANELTEFGGVVEQSEDGSFSVFGLRSDKARGESVLRLVNLADQVATVEIHNSISTDSQSATSLLLRPQASSLLTYSDLVSGSHILEGSLESAERLSAIQVTSGLPLEVQHLVRLGDGSLTNISRTERVSIEQDVFLPLFTDPLDANETTNFIELYNPGTSNTIASMQVLTLAGDALASFELSVPSKRDISISSDDLWQGNEDLGVPRMAALDEKVVYFKVTSPNVLLARTQSSSTSALVSTLQQSLILGSEPRMQPELTLGDCSGARWMDRTWHFTNQTSESTHLRLRYADGRVDTVQLETLATHVVDHVTHSNGESNQDESSEKSIRVSSDSEVHARCYVRRGDGFVNLTPIPVAREQGTRVLDEHDTSRQFFAERIYPSILRADCMNCHVSGGLSGNTRLVFVWTNDPDHEQKNYEILTSFFNDIDNGPAYLLRKMRGQGHGGGARFGRSSSQYQDMERLIELLEEEKNRPEPPPPLTAADLVDIMIKTESEKRTLWKATLIMAGRVPTNEEFEMLDGTEGSLRKAIRGVLTGKGFEAFVSRSVNDRLLTNRDTYLLNRRDGVYPNYTNQLHELISNTVDEPHSAQFWDAKVQYGVRSEPSQLVVHVATNDLPYSDLLLADYVLANPYSASIYGSEVEFEDLQDHQEFKPTQIVDYVRKCDGFMQEETEHGPRVVSPGPCQAPLPLAGLLSSKAFLQRHPTSPTNRNRARSRWTQHHFLGLDILNSSSRVVDRRALSDPNNPTLGNRQCSVCHTQLDPVAGAFQDYDVTGLFRSSIGGSDSLDSAYRNRLFNREEFQAVTSKSVTDTQEISVSQHLVSGEIGILFEVSMDPSIDVAEDTDFSASVAIGSVRVLNSGNTVVARFDPADYSDEDDAVGVEILTNSDGQVYGLSVKSGHELEIPLRLADEGTYSFETSVWEHESSTAGAGNAIVRITPEYFYRGGDSWYRDMLAPGLGEAAIAVDAGPPLNWLAMRLAEDERFIPASVEFWWTALFGRALSELPTDEEAPDYLHKLLGAEAERLIAARLAEGWEDGFGTDSPLVLRDLLTEIAMSSWFRADGFEDDVPADVRTALANVGVIRLLSPEELSAKTESVTGIAWRSKETYRVNQRPEEYASNMLLSGKEAALLYGGIDAGSVSERETTMTPIISRIAQSHALEMSCPTVYREMYLLPVDQRRLFSDIDLWDAPIPTFGRQIEVESGDDSTEFTVSGSLPVGEAEISIQYVNAGTEVSDESGVIVEGIRLLRGNQAVLQISTFDSDNTQIEGSCNTVGDNLVLRCDDAIRFSHRLTSLGTYRLEVDVRSEGSDGHLPKLNLTVQSFAPGTSNIGQAVKDKLVELHALLLGHEISPDAPEIESRYEFLKATVARGREGKVSNFNGGERCDFWSGDYRYLQGIDDDAITQKDDEGGGYTKEMNADAMARLWTENGRSDPVGMANAWTLVLASFLLDYEYLHF